MSVRIPSSGLVEQGVEVRFDPKTGSQTVRRWSGTESQIKAQAASLFGWTTVMRQTGNGEEWELEANISADDVKDVGENPVEVVDQWEMFANKVEKDILDSDITAVTSLNNSDLKKLRDIADGREDVAPYTTTAPSFVCNTCGDPIGLFGLILAGVKSSLVLQPVIRRTRTVSSNYIIQSSINNAGYIYSTTAAAAELLPPPGIRSNMPASSTKTRAITGSVNLSFYFGWLKNYPQISGAAYGKVQIIQEWEWGLWSATVFGGRTVGTFT
jgi:hypothetical protein